MEVQDFGCSVFRDQGNGHWKEEKAEGPKQDGGVAQLGEHLPCKQGVMGSIPIISIDERESSKEPLESNGL